jgi:hypothetical protein
LLVVADVDDFMRRIEIEVGIDKRTSEIVHLAVGATQSPEADENRFIERIVALVLVKRICATPDLRAGSRQSRAVDSWAIGRLGRRRQG